MNSPEGILDDAPASYEQEAQRRRVLGAAHRACALTVDERGPANDTYVVSGDGFLEASRHDIVLDH
jgi:hypothetical protein